MEDRRHTQHGNYLSNESVGELNEVHGWFQFSDAQSDVSRAFANNAVHRFIESAKEAEQVKEETGLTPRQLAEQRAELLGALKDSLVIHAGLSADKSEDLALIRQIITKCEAKL